jgi:hypothetical protein
MTHPTFMVANPPGTVVFVVWQVTQSSEVSMWFPGFTMGTTPVAKDWPPWQELHVAVFTLPECTMVRTVKLEVLTWQFEQSRPARVAIWVALFL